MTRFAGLALCLAAAERIPGTGWLGRRITALHWRSIGLVFGGCVAVLILAEVVEDAVEPPGPLADHLAATYPGLRDARPPLEVSVEGRFTGPPIPPDCRYVELYGWIDPDAGRLTSKGSPGDWCLGYEWTLDGEIRSSTSTRCRCPTISLHGS